MSGLLDLLMSGFPVKPKTPPQVTQNTIEVSLTADELKALLFGRADPRYQNLIDVEIRDNKLVIKFRLF
jgi:hypothetical protein